MHQIHPTRSLASAALVAIGLSLAGCAQLSEALKKSGDEPTAAECNKLYAESKDRFLSEAEKKRLEYCRSNRLIDIPVKALPQPRP
jgi:hypothetical protein